MKEKIDNLSVAKKSALVFFVVNFLAQASHMITTPIFTRIMSVREFGITTLFNSWQSLIGMLAMLSLSSNVFNVGLNEYKDDRDGFSFNVLLVSGCATFVVMGIIFALYAMGWNITSLPLSLLVVMALYFFFVPAYNFWITRQRYEYKYKVSGIVSLMLTFSSAFLSVVWVLGENESKAEAKIYGTCLPFIVTGLFLYIYLLRKTHAVKWDYWSFVLKFNLPLLFHYMALNVMTSSDRIMISNIISEDKAGIYGLSYSLSSVITIVWNAINGAFVPYLYEKLNELKDIEIRKTVDKIIFLYMMVCCIFTFFAPEMLYIFATSEYSEGVNLIPVLVASFFFQGIFYVYVNISLYYKKTVGVMVASILAAILNIFLNYVGIKFFGYYAAAYATLITVICLCIFHYIYMRKISGRKILGVKNHIIMGIFMIGFMSLSKYFYENIWIKTIIITVAIFLFIKNKEKMLNLMR